MVNLKFDIDQFDAAIREYDEIKTTISQRKAAIEQEISSINTTDWNTKAGDKFKEISEGDWAEHIDQFAVVLDELKVILQTAKNDYQTVEERLKELTF